MLSGSLPWFADKSETGTLRLASMWTRMRDCVCCRVVACVPTLLIGLGELYFGADSHSCRRESSGVGLARHSSLSRLWTTTAGLASRTLKSLIDIALASSSLLDYFLPSIASALGEKSSPSGAMYAVPTFGAAALRSRPSDIRGR